MENYDPDFENAKLSLENDREFVKFFTANFLHNNPNPFYGRRYIRTYVRRLCGAACLSSLNSTGRSDHLGKIEALRSYFVDRFTQSTQEDAAMMPTPTGIMELSIKQVLAKDKRFNQYKLTNRLVSGVEVRTCISFIFGKDSPEANYIYTNCGRPGDDLAQWFNDNPGSFAGLGDQVSAVSMPPPTPIQSGGEFKLEIPTMSLKIITKHFIGSGVLDIAAMTNEAIRVHLAGAQAQVESLKKVSPLPKRIAKEIAEKEKEIADFVAFLDKQDEEAAAKAVVPAVAGA